MSSRPSLSGRRARELAGGAWHRAETELSWLRATRRGRDRHFVFDGETYEYAVERYNTTWLNERTVEIPIALAAIRRRPGSRVLELGNVLGHYGVTGQTVVDKYERSERVINCDVLDYHDSDGFDLIVSISTLEHTGYEEEQLEPDKPAKVMDHLAGLLRGDDAEVLVTFPLGYNPHLDRLLDEKPDPFGRLGVLRRISTDNRWREEKLVQLSGTRYASPYPAANALVVARRGARARTD